MHCAYMWRKLHRAVVRNGSIDGYIASYGHTNQCSTMLMSGELRLRGMDQMVKIVRKYTTYGGQMDGARPGWYRILNGTILLFVICRPNNPCSKYMSE